MEKKETRVKKVIREKMVWTEEMDRKAQLVPLVPPENKVFEESEVLKVSQEELDRKGFKVNEVLRANPDHKELRSSR